MTLNADRLREEKPERTARGYTTQEQWEVWDGDTTTGTYNDSAALAPVAAMFTIGLPQYGNVHPTLPGAVVVDVQVIQVVANWSVIFLVTYRGWGLFTGGPRATVSSYGEDKILELPVWRKMAQSDINTGTYVVYPDYADPKVYWQRTHVYRTEVRWVGGNMVDAITTAIAINAGCYYIIGGNNYLLSGKSSSSYDGLGLTRVSYQFYTMGPVAGIPAGSAFGNDYAIPPLPSLYVYSSHLNPSDRSAAPIITAVPFGLPAPAGGALPGFP